MTEPNKTKALEVLGLAPGASKSQIDEAYQKANAFFSGDGAADATKAVAELVRIDIEEAYKTLSELAPAGGGTVSGGTAQQPTKAPGGKGNGLAWIVGIVLVCGLVYQLNHKEPTPPIRIDPPPKGGDTDHDEPPVVQQPDQPPDFVAPFIHSDDVYGKAVRWTSQDQNVNGAQRKVVWAFYDYAMRQPLYKFELYDDMGRWREYRHYIIRYAADDSQVAVQRFQEKGAVAEMKDQSNVSDKGDVLVQTTTYFFSGGKLDAVRVDTPFMQNKDGLKISRDGGQLYVERVPSGGSLNISANTPWLNNLFDLWDVFGAPSL